MDYYGNPNGEAVKQLDRRFSFILQHRNDLMGSRIWGNIPEAVFMIEAENEAMGAVEGITGAIAGRWQCGKRLISFRNPSFHVFDII